METQPNITILFLGDIIGKPGRRVVRRYLSALDVRPDLIVANVENVAHGFGVTENNLTELKECGIQAFTGGNHTFDRKEIFEFINKESMLMRPANYPEGTPGKGSCSIELANGVRVAIINVMGRVFMEPLQSPFLIAEELAKKASEETNLIFVDFHAEATAEKVAMGWYLDGRVSAVVGTHTHVQTADERILPGGTAYLTDAGCCGPADGVIGMDRENVFRRMVKQVPTRLEIAAGPAMLNGVKITIDSQSGKAQAIERVHYRETAEEAEAQ